MNRNDEDGELSFSYLYTDIDSLSCNICGSDEIPKTAVRNNETNIINQRLRDLAASKLANNKSKMAIEDLVNNDAKRTELNLNLAKLRSDILALTEKNRKS